MISNNPRVFFKVLDCYLFTRRVVVNEVYHQNINNQLTHQTACCNFLETIAGTFIILSGHNQFIREIFFTTQRNVTEIIFYREKMFTVKVDQFGTVAKNLCEFFLHFTTVTFSILTFCNGAFVGFNSFSTSCRSLLQNN